MSHDQPDSAMTEPTLQHSPLDYEPPQLNELGTLAELTLGDGLGEDDGFTGASTGPT